MHLFVAVLCLLSIYLPHWVSARKVWNVSMVFGLFLLQCGSLDTYPLTCAPAQTGEQPPPCQDSASVPSTLGAFSLSGMLPCSSVCEHTAHQTVPRTHCQIVPLCFRHHTCYHYFLHHPPNWVWGRLVQSPESSVRNWWWSSWGKQVYLEMGEDLGRVDKGTVLGLTQSYTWDWELLHWRRMLKSTGAVVGAAENAE